MLDLLSRMFQSVVTPMLWLSLTAAFVAVIVMILRRILRSRIPHQALCVLWMIVFARLLLPVSVETPFSLVPSNITNQIYQTEQEPEQPVEPEAESQPSAVIPERPEPVEPAPAPGVSTPVSQPQIPATSEPIPSLPVASSPVVSQPEDPVVSDPVVPEPQPSAPPMIEEEPSVSEEPVLSDKELLARSGQAIAASVWLLGVAAMLVSGIVSYAKLRRQVYDAIHAEDGVWEHPSLRSPFILGLFRPNIYLPMGIAGPARQFILHHERAHLRRWDHVVKPICWLALAIHWFNPFAWGAFLLMSRDIEAACDESVIRKLGSEVKADYSATLLALATDKRFPAPSPLSFGEGDADSRIKNVLRFKKPALWVSAAAVVIVAAAVVCLLTNRSEVPVNASSKDWYPEAIVFDEKTEFLLFDKNNNSITKAYRMDGKQPKLISGFVTRIELCDIAVIHPDGTREGLTNPRLPTAFYEQYLVDAAREIDPNWETSLGSQGGFHLIGTFANSAGSISVDAYLTPYNHLLLSRDGIMEVIAFQTEGTSLNSFYDPENLVPADGLWATYSVDRLKSGIIRDIDYDGEDELALVWSHNDGSFSMYVYEWLGDGWNEGTLFYGEEVPEVLDAVIGDREDDQTLPTIADCITHPDYPGLYFLEKPSSTVGTKVTAYKLIDGELVLVGGYEEHQANNFDVLIHADGELEAIWSGQDVYTKFEELLTAALAPDWTHQPRSV